MKQVRPRSLAAAGLITAALALAGCGGDDGPAAASGPTKDTGCGFSSGPSSDSVSVVGDFGGEATATFAEPLRPVGLERTVVTTGSGKPTRAGSTVNATVSVFNGRNGDLISRQTSTTTVGGQGSRIADAGTGCVRFGSRVVAVAPASELFGPEGSPAAGLAASDGIVVVTDVAEVAKRPVTRTWADAPAVTFRGQRSPVVDATSVSAPDGVLVDPITPGTGSVVRAGDLVTLNYKLVVAGSGKVVSETYGPGKKPVSYRTNDFVPGFTAAIVGQRAGAQLLVAVPPEFGYGAAGAESAGISASDTLLIVIEIQATQR
ncbi:MAG: FKBP-type peptidyl-prolyl cis-trans isomerase [Propionibacteriales bacterium]|nr:FKBP-type peptidyl-prolyl cis-trans isomerase [Propionibacteriales bacterium]